jgi:protein gp37
VNKTNIEWCDYTWNPVTGCLHGCEYCYARRIAKRFEGGGYGKEMGMFIAKHRDDAFKSPYVIDEPHYTQTKDDWYRVAPYPFGFEPTFHRYRLNEPQQVKKPSKIFVCSMADLFGDWVPGDWIEEVFRACEDAAQHKYLFLTKNPKGLKYPFHQYFNNKNWWIGTSVTCNADHQRAWDLLQETTRKTNKFLSIEPIHGEFDLVKYDLLYKGYPKIVTIGDYYNWVIVGAETGNRKDKIIPKREWIENIVSACRHADVPVFMKDSLKDLMGKEFIQEYPNSLCGRKENESDLSKNLARIL